MTLNHELKYQVDAKFKAVNCHGSELNGIQFESCRFENCDWSEAQVRGCEFIDCEFIGCQLAGVKFCMSRFQDVVFTDCDLSSINWTLADWSGFVLNAPFKFKNCVLNQSSFYGLELKSLSLVCCEARAVDFREADLVASDFEGSDFSHALFAHCDLSDVNFVGTKGIHLDLNNNTLKGARFERMEAVSLLSSLGIELVD